MKKDDFYYFRGKKKVTFQPRDDLLAVSLKPDLTKDQVKEFLAHIEKLKLHFEKIGPDIQNANVRVLRLPPETDEDDKKKINKSLCDIPLVMRVGAIIHLSNASISFMTDEFTVKFKKRISDGELKKIAHRENVEVTRKLPYAKETYVLKTEGAHDYRSLEKANRFAEMDIVESAEPSFATTTVDDYTPTDFLFSDQPHHQIINTEDAWEITRGDNDIIIAVVDNKGCDIDHPDFTNTIAAGWDKIHEPFDFANMDNDPFYAGQDHGTKCCGIAAANTDGTEGTVGVAPGCRLMPIRKDSSSTDIQIADMYVWIAGFDPISRDRGFPEKILRGADVISSSFGRPEAAIQLAMEEALDFITRHGRNGRGCVVVFSVGNDNADFTVLHNAGTGDDYGGRQWAAHDRTIAVASSTISPPDPDEVKAGSSNFGPLLDVCAPGGGNRYSGEARTISTDNVDEGTIRGTASAETADYSDFGQTSCACPQVAGVAALMLSVNPDLNWRDVRQIIRDTAEHIDSENTDPIGQWEDTDGDGEIDFSQWYGYGRIDAYLAVRRVLDELPIKPAAVVDIETIIAAQEVIYMRRIVALMKKFIDECPTPPPDPFDSVTIPLKLVEQHMNQLEQLNALRTKYTSSMLPDHELLKAVATICHKNGDLIEEAMPDK